MAATGRVQGAIGKLDGFALRLAMLLEYLTWAWRRGNTVEPEVISLACVRSSIALIEQWVRPTLARVFAEASLPQVHRDAMTVARWLLKTRPAANDHQRAGVAAAGRVPRPQGRKASGCGARIPRGGQVAQARDQAPGGSGAAPEGLRREPPHLQCGRLKSRDAPPMSKLPKLSKNLLGPHFGNFDNFGRGVEKKRRQA